MTPPALRTELARVVAAEVNHGRWIVRCPVCPCAEHEGSSGFNARTFVCAECGTTGQVSFPTERSGVERALSVRPPANRNWSPGETVDQLHAENRVNM